MADARPLLYLDIDGVCLKRRHRSVSLFDAFELAPGCLDFLIWTTTEFRVRWLSMRCRSDPDGARRAFHLAGASVATDQRWAVLDQIEAAAWGTSKVEAIDAASDFWWVDDNPSDDEREWLVRQGVQDRLIEVSSDRDADALVRARAVLEKGARGRF
jgi:hypothetical protein